MGRPRQGWKLRDPRPPLEPFYTVRFTNKAGRRVELTTGASDIGEASRVAADLYARDLTSSGALVRSRVDPLLALDELMALCLADLLKTHDVTTVAQYARDSKRLAAHFGNTMANVHTARMADYQRDRLTQVLAKTVRKERSVFNTFLAWCVEQGVLASTDVPLWPKIPKKTVGVRSGPQRENPVDVTREQVGAFLEALPLWSKHGRGTGHRHAIRARFIVAYETGLRPATLDELELGRHWKLGNGFIDLTSDIDKARFGRQVPITRLAQAALTFVVVELGITGGLIFGAHDYRDAVAAAAAAAGLPKDFAVYDLRHGRIGHLLDETGDVRAVMFLVGHLLMTTTNHYVRGQRSGARRALSAMAGACECGHVSSLHEGSEGPCRATVDHHDGRPENPCTCAAFRGGSGEETKMLSGAKEGSRTPTRVTSPEPESGARHLVTNSSGQIAGQGGALRDSQGQGYGDIPETQIPKSVRDATVLLAAMRGSEDALERALAGELLGGES